MPVSDFLSLCYHIHNFKEFIYEEIHFYRCEQCERYKNLGDTARTLTVKRNHSLHLINKKTTRQLMSEAKDTVKNDSEICPKSPLTYRRFSQHPKQKLALCITCQNCSRIRLELAFPAYLGLGII